MRKAYLTIDDTPTEKTDELTDFLAVRDIQAILFCRGDRLAENMDPAVRAIERGQVLANHTYHHRRASEISYEEEIDEIARTDALIDAAYKQAGKARPGKYFRFSYMDRGCGAYVVDYDAMTPEDRAIAQCVFGDGLNFPDPSPPSPALVEKKNRIQDYLRGEGFCQPFKGVTQKWFSETEVAQAADCMFTFSNNDWMLTARHLAKDWPYKTIDDLKRRIDDDPVLQDESTAHIILAHDQAEIMDVTLATIQHFIDRGFSFERV